MGLVGQNSVVKTVYANGVEELLQKLVNCLVQDEYNGAVRVMF